MIKPAAPADADAPLARWSARLALGFRADDRGTRLAHRAHHGPLVVQKPLWPEGPDLCHALIVHPPGGIAGGDALDIDIALEPRANALVTTPAATRWYRARHTDVGSSQHVHIAAAPGATVEWLPQENIYFDGVAAHSSLDVTLAPDARFVAWEISCFGRTRSGERFERGVVRQDVSIRVGDALIWREAGRFHAGSALGTSPVGFNGANVCGTMLAVGGSIDDASLAAARAIASEVEARATPGARSMAAVSRLPRVFVARYLGHSSEEARTVFAALWSIVRPAVTGRPATAPRIWAT